MGTGPTKKSRHGQKKDRNKHMWQKTKYRRMDQDQQITQNKTRFTTGELKQNLNNNVHDFDESKKGAGQFQCALCDTHNQDQEALDQHQLKKQHKRMLKKEQTLKPHTDLDALKSIGKGIQNF